MDKLFIVIPAYNEETNIRRTIDEWYPIVEKYNGDGQSRLVIINDGSKDNTYQILCDCAKTRPLLTPLTKPNGGHGPTLLYGYDYAIKNGADFIFQEKVFPYGITKVCVSIVEPLSSISCVAEVITLKPAFTRASPISVGVA